MLKIVTDGSDRDDLAGVLDELVTEGARRMLVAALEAEVADYVDRRHHVVDEDGRRLVVRNGKAKERTLVTGAGGGLPDDVEIQLGQLCPEDRSRDRGHR
jgi:hypothetical protein